LRRENPVIITRAELPGDRQRYKYAHELRQKIIEAGLNIEIKNTAKYSQEYFSLQLILSVLTLGPIVMFYK
jgi:hypothetical protein